MAISLTTSTICISSRDPLGFSSRITTNPGSTTLLSNPIKLRFGEKKHTSFSIQSSSDISPSAETTTDVDSETSVEASASKPPPYSLISALNVEKVLRGIAITDVDHYDRLGIQIGCPYDQVGVAYKSMAEKLMNQGLEEEKLNEMLELLKESYMILSSEEERRLYDWSLARVGKSDDTYIWPFEVDITQIQTQEPPPPEPEDVGPTRLVGYFFLAWLILGFTLSIGLNL